MWKRIASSLEELIERCNRLQDGLAAIANILDEPTPQLVNMIQSMNGKRASSVDRASVTVSDYVVCGFRSDPGDTYVFFTHMNLISRRFYVFTKKGNLIDASATLAHWKTEASRNKTTVAYMQLEMDKYMELNSDRIDIETRLAAYRKRVDGLMETMARDFFRL
jgi:hypothetical protein